MRFLPDHDGALVLDHHHAVLIDPARAYLHHALARPRLRFAHADHLGLGIERIAGKDRIGELDIVPAQRESVLAQVGHPKAGDHGERQRAVDQRLLELGAACIMRIEMDLVGVVGDHGELNIVRLGNGAAEPAAIDVADREILEEPSVPALLDVAHAGSSHQGIITILPKKSRASMRASASPNWASGKVRACGFLILPSAISTMPRRTSSLV